MTDRDRKAFEAWYGVEMPPRFNQSGKYCRELVESMWCAWQAAIKLERESCAKECDEMPQRLGIHCARAIRARSEEGNQK